MLRNITLLYDVFKVCEDNFSAEKHDCRILSENSYLVPKDFNEQRNYLQGTAYGQEQMFSTYLNLFYPSCFEGFDDRFSWPKIPGPALESSMGRALSKFKRITPKKILDRFLYPILRLSQPRVAVIESYFSARNRRDLEIAGRGYIRWLTIRKGFEYSTVIQWDKRTEISQVTKDYDRFDQFFFTSLKYCFPKVFVEDFNQVYSTYDQYFKNFNKLKYVVNESWIGNNYSAMAIAVLQQKGVSHIYNEHNFLSHQFLCSNHKYIFPLVDKFVTLGWSNDSIPNLVKGSSLYEWVVASNCSKEHDILYIAGPPAVKSPEISGSYGGFGGFNANLHLKFITSFFGFLSQDTITRIVYRDFPLDAYPVAQIKPQMISYDQNFVLRDYLKVFNRVDRTSSSAKELMQKSRLVVADYLGTAYMESMKANIPTIFFFCKDSHFLGDNYEGFYSSLVSVGICQTSPESAATLIESIKDDPAKWWNQEAVQRARSEFLAQNLSDFSILQGYLHELVFES